MHWESFLLGILILLAGLWLVWRMIRGIRQPQCMCGQRRCPLEGARSGQTCPSAASCPRGEEGGRADSAAASPPPAEDGGASEQSDRREES